MTAQVADATADVTGVVAGKEEPAQADAATAKAAAAAAAKPEEVRTPKCACCAMM